VSDPPFPVPIWAAATLPKPGYADHENEDAVGGNAATLRFAVADGATEGWKSGEWARHLVASYIKKPPMPANFPEWVEGVRKEWPERTATATADEPWFAQAKREEGAFATFAGFELMPGKERGSWRWKALAVGDSCLFRFREGKLVDSFPLNTVEQFGTRPQLLASSPSVPLAEPEWLAGKAEAGDLLALATDAVAAGILLIASKNDTLLVPELAGFNDATRRNRALLAFLQQLPTLREDDLSLLAVYLPPTP